MTTRKRHRFILRRQWPLMVWLVIVWVALWGDISFANILGGLAIAIMLGLTFPMPVFPARLRVRPWPLIVLLAVFWWDLVRASFEVAWLAWRPGPPATVAVLKIPMSTGSEAVLTVVAEFTSLVPGSIVLETDATHRVMYVHTLGLDNAEDFQRFRDITWALEKRVIAAFGTEFTPITTQPNTIEHQRLDGTDSVESVESSERPEGGADR